jgi:hypothetical protein
MSASLRFFRYAGVTLLALGLMTVTAWAQPRGSFTAGPLTAQAGEKVSGLIQVPAAADEGTTLHPRHTAGKSGRAAGDDRAPRRNRTMIF